MGLSLRSFHVFFIAASIALSAWVGVWGIASWRAGEGANGLALAALFLALGVVLLVYFVRVRRKFREMGPEGLSASDHRFLTARAAALGATAAVVLPRLAGACATCFGAADSPMVHGQNHAILALLAVVGVVQVGVVKVVWDFRQRAKRLPPPPSAAPPRNLRLIHGGKD